MNDASAGLEEAVAGTPLAAGFAVSGASFLERRAGDPVLERMAPALRTGLARVLASEPQVGGFLTRRSELLERLARTDAGSLASRERELAAESPEPGDVELESALDALRLLRREETCIAACLDLAGLVPFEGVSAFLSALAEHIARRAHALARRSLSSAGGPPLSVLTMGKLAGREFTYHSDLDLVFLVRGGLEELETASRTAQRMISYLTTMTGAGVAYAVDARLRPSGQQGALVTTFEGFERYQTEEAETWEHVALLRSRPLAGEREVAAALLARVRGARLGRARPWAYLADLRKRVEAERAEESGGAIAFKTGAGGLMDVEFLAAGGLLERGGPFPAIPSTPAMLRAAQGGPRVETLLADYADLRRLEARARWCAGRGVESLDPDPERRAIVAELLEPGLGAEGLAERVGVTRRRIRAAWDAVIAADSITGLGE